MDVMSKAINFSWALWYSNSQIWATSTKFNVFLRSLQIWLFCPKDCSSSVCHSTFIVNIVMQTCIIKKQPLINHHSSYLCRVSLKQTGMSVFSNWVIRCDVIAVLLSGEWVCSFLTLKPQHKAFITCYYWNHKFWDFPPRFSDFCPLKMYSLSYELAGSNVM